MSPFDTYAFSGPPGHGCKPSVFILSPSTCFPPAPRLHTKSCTHAPPSLVASCLCPGTASLESIVMRRGQGQSHPARPFARRVACLPSYLVLKFLPGPGILPSRLTSCKKMRRVEPPSADIADGTVSATVGMVTLGQYYLACTASQVHPFSLRGRFLPTSSNHGHAQQPLIGVSCLLFYIFNLGMPVVSAAFVTACLKSLIHRQHLLLASPCKSPGALWRILLFPRPEYRSLYTSHTYRPDTMRSRLQKSWSS